MRAKVVKDIINKLDDDAEVAFELITTDDVHIISEQPESQEQKRFWMCFVEGGNSPKHRHTDYRLAVQEAERLARVTCRRVHLLNNTASVVFVPPVKHTGLKWTRHC